jgi:ABC-type multidrug transport system ATPase subunit
VLIEPTSAVDAHTESQIAERLREARDGRTTVVVTASPLLLDRMDAIAVVRKGRVVGTGTHQELLRQEDDLGELYRAIVSRTISAAEPADGEDLDAAWTGSIDALWTATHPVQAQKAAKQKNAGKQKKTGKQKKAKKDKHTKGDGDAASDR